MLKNQAVSTTILDQVKWSMYNVEIQPNDYTKGKFLLYNTASGKMITSPASFTALQNHYESAVPLQDTHAKLFDLGFLVPSYLNELAYTRHEYQELFNKGTSQQLIIMPTEQCNFRCVYCYEEFLKGKMSEELQSSLVQWVQRNIEKWDFLTVGWFGGEPLVAYDVVENVSQKLYDICTANGVAFLGTMTTNGYLLTVDRARRLFELGVSKYQITVDGTEEYHDQTRILMGGQGTYQQIMTNLISIRDSDLDVQIKIRMNFTSENAPNIRVFLDELVTTFGTDARFTFDLHAVGKWGGKNDEVLPVCTAKDANLIALEETWYGLEQGLHSEKYSDALLNHNVCYAAKPNSLVIGSDGMIYKCTVAFNNPVNQVGQLHADGVLELDQMKFSQWVSVDGLSDKVCQSCKLHPICHGAYCPLVRIEQESARPCPPLKSKLEDYVSLRYRQATFHKTEA
ncbi:uncharacterized protein EV586_103204 [Tumebacillus sp. BK434]|uniref:radical SAM/SPASM domain-containing protein n=1 Tax=Tumebacillus sp. BK434 TaxID=2512169 RepID=UPI0010EA53A7|nr:radical SAM protein [Tumebacillus sp. BK434]TCP55551.1 uncharacterized protein EV586_103204 [Tumebacillus sp. BK434]